MAVPTTKRYPINTDDLKPFQDKPWIWGEEWCMAVVPHSLAMILQQPHLVHNALWLDVPWSNGYACDPWLVKHQNENYVFFEYCDRRSNRGIIGCGVLQSRNGQWHLDDVRRVLEEPHHLSHPCVFQYDDQWYLIPESADSGEITLYEAIDFPFRWRKREAILPGVPGLDPTFVVSKDRCWIFCNIKDQADNSDLYLFHAPSPLGPWKEHPENPVKSDRCGSRSAGPIFSNGTSLIRPGQDSRFTYGQNIIFHEIHNLDPIAFSESPIAYINAPVRRPFNHGVHTLCSGDELCLIDAKRYTGLKKILGPWVASARRWQTSRGQDHD